MQLYPPAPALFATAAASPGLRSEITITSGISTALARVDACDGETLRGEPGTRTAPTYDAPDSSAT